MSETFVLYRFFAQDDRLLYVGLTRNPARRFDQHRDGKPWWSKVARIEMEHFSTLLELKGAERRAIEGERPEHNIKMNGGNRLAAPDEVEPPPVAHCGLEMGRVYAIGCDDGECPVGMVEGLDGDGVSISQLNWIVGIFDDVIWVPYKAIRRWTRADVEKVTPGKRASDGFWYGDMVKELHLTEPLGDFQTRWLEKHRAAS